MSKKDHATEAERISSLLLSAESEQVRKGIDECHNAHHAAIILPLLTLLKDPAMREFHAEVRAMLNSIKASGAIDFLMQAFRNPVYEEVRPEIVCAMWSAPIPTGNAFIEILEAALKSDLRLQMETITLIEENTADISEEQILEAYEVITRHIKETNDKNPMLWEMHRAISQLRAQSEAE
jgi:hypothetical protein